MHKLLILVSILITGLSACAQDRPDDQSSAPTPQIVASPEPHVWIAGQPSPADLDQWAAAGVTHVVVSRTQAEIDALPFDYERALTERGIAFTHLPMGRSAGFPADTASRLHPLLAEPNGIVVLACRTGNRSSHAYAAYATNARQASLASLESLLNRPLSRSNVQRLGGSP